MKVRLLALVLSALAILALALGRSAPAEPVVLGEPIDAATPDPYCAGMINGPLCMTDAKVQSRLTETVLAYRAAEIRRSEPASRSKPRAEAPKPKPAPKPAPVSTPKPKPKPAVAAPAGSGWAAAASVWDDYPAWVGRFALCVANHESMNAGLWTAQNPYSSASGAFQFIDGSWRAYSRSAGLGGYARAKHAPPVVQAQVFAHVVTEYGAYPWKGTHCGYGT